MTRALRWLAAPVLCGLIAAFLVCAGEAGRWDGFNTYDGFWGAHWLDSMLYAMHDPAGAVNTVAAVWFTQAFFACVGLELLAFVIWRSTRAGSLRREE
jgi:hypothetical protein